MRLIDADALVQKWYKINDIDEDDRGARFVGYTEIVRMINNAPTINEWIPCSERLPEEDKPVLVAVKTADRLPKWVDNRTFHHVTDIDVYDSDKGWYTNKKKVVAWMELPEPYKESDTK